MCTLNPLGRKTKRELFDELSGLEQILESSRQNLERLEGIVRAELQLYIENYLEPRRTELLREIIARSNAEERKLPQTFGGRVRRWK